MPHEVSIPLMILPIFHDGYGGVHLSNRSSTAVWHTRLLGEIINRRANPMNRLLAIILAGAVAGCLSYSAH
jgi:hypothetical protein